MSADFNMGCFQGFCFSFIVCGVLAGSEANFVYFASLVLDIDSCPSIPNCILSRAISVHMSSGLFRVVGLKAFLSKGLSLRAALGVFLTNTRDGTLTDGRSSLTPGRNGKTWGGEGGGRRRSLWGHDQGCPPVVVQVFCSVLQSALCWLRQSLPHRVVLQPLEFGSLVKLFEIPAIIK